MLINSNEKNSIIALDIGDKRIGVAIANVESRMPNNLTVLKNDSSFLTSLAKIIADNNVTKLVVGLPRSMSGEETLQSSKVRKLTKQIETLIKLPIVFQDEFLTSVKAEEILTQRKKGYSKEDIDMYSASLILEDYLSSND